MLISFPFSVIFFFFFFFCRDLADFHLNTLHVGLCQSDSGSSLNCFISIFVSVLCISCIYFSVISHQKQEPSPSACLHDDISLCLQSFWSFPSTVSSPFLLAFLPVIPACVICHQGFSPPHLHPHLLAADVMWCDGIWCVIFVQPLDDFISLSSLAVQFSRPEMPAAKCCSGFLHRPLVCDSPTTGWLPVFHHVTSATW